MKRRTPLTERAEVGLLVVILAVVAVSAGWASFTHVHDWTMRHAPVNTPDAFGWVNAVISELVPVAAFITIKHRRRAKQPYGYPLFLLIAAALLSLAAQLAVAERSLSGWLLSAVPALAFLGLSKLVLTGRKPCPEPEPVPDAEPTGDTADVDKTEPSKAVKKQNPADLTDLDDLFDPDSLNDLALPPLITVDEPPTRVPPAANPAPIPAPVTPRPVAAPIPALVVSSVIQPPRTTTHAPVSSAIR